MGVDIEEVERFKKLIRNKRFLKRVFTNQEIRYCSSRKNKAQHFAVRFAAKEAVWKALSHIMARSKNNITHNQIGIKNLQSGKPEVVLPRPLSRWKNKVAVSLSHTRHYAVATALIQG